jgi:hypothetical protein
VVVRLARGVTPSLIRGRLRARTTVTPTNLTTSASTTDGSSFLTASISPAAAAVQYIGVTHHQSGGQPTPTVTGCSLTWVQEETQVLGTTRRLTVFRAHGTPTTGQLTIDFAGATQTACAWSVVECAGADLSGTSGSAATRQSVPATAAAVTTITSTLAALEHAGNVHLCFVALSTNVDVVPDAQFAELGDSGAASTAVRIESEWAVGELTCDPTFTSSDVAVISIEVVAG